MMAEDYAHGRRDGLRLALAVLAAEEAKWAALFGESPSWRNSAIREARHKTLRFPRRGCEPSSTGILRGEGSAISDELANALKQVAL